METSLTSGVNWARCDRMPACISHKENNITKTDIKITTHEEEETVPARVQLQRVTTEHCTGLTLHRVTTTQGYHKSKIKSGRISLGNFWRLEEMRRVFMIITS